MISFRTKEEVTKNCNANFNFKTVLEETIYKQKQHDIQQIHEAIHDYKLGAIIPLKTRFLSEEDVEKICQQLAEVGWNTKHEPRMFGCHFLHIW